MKHSYLNATYREGRPFAAYYSLPRRSGDCSTRTKRIPGGILVDFAADGRAIGIEITSHSRLDLSSLNEALVVLGLSPVRPEELAPLFAA
jgi:uncharacterized protein YuzE